MLKLRLTAPALKRDKTHPVLMSLALRWSGEGRQDAEVEKCASGPRLVFALLPYSAAVSKLEI